MGQDPHRLGLERFWVQMGSPKGDLGPNGAGSKRDHAKTGPGRNGLGLKQVGVQPGTGPDGSGTGPLHGLGQFL